MAGAIDNLKSGYSITDVIEGNLGENIDLSGITSFTRRYLFENSTIKRIDAPDLTASASHAFYGAKNLEVINAPLLSSTNEYGFAGCSKLKTLIHPYDMGFGQHAFDGCASLQIFVTNNTGAFTETFKGCSSLEVIDYGKRFNATRQNAFNGCVKLKTFIIRAEKLVALQHINMFNNSPFASNGTGGTLYVPQDLISSYQSATNWSVILGYANNQILPIEGSIYESQYADGTPIT